MTQAIRLTKAQKRKFYREAVQETLITIYGKPESVSKALVSAWWKRVSKTEDFDSDLLFHAEPLHTAADIAHLKSIAITSENEEIYRRLLRRTRNRVLEKSKQSQVPTQHVRAGLAAQEIQANARRTLQQRKAKKPAEQKLLARS
jgi:hypothetical protein